MYDSDRGPVGNSIEMRKYNAREYDDDSDSERDFRRGPTTSNIPNWSSVLSSTDLYLLIFLLASFFNFVDLLGLSAS